jgi:hypothetical protein
MDKRRPTAMTVIEMLVLIIRGVEVVGRRWNDDTLFYTRFDFNILSID